MSQPPTTTTSSVGTVKVEVLESGGDLGRCERETPARLHIQVESKQPLETFTAEDAQRMATRLHSQAFAPLLSGLRSKCIADIKKAIHQQQKESTFEVDTTTLEAVQKDVAAKIELTNLVEPLSEALIRNLENELLFTVLRKFSSSSNRFRVRWHNEFTIDLSDEEIQRRKIEVEQRYVRSNSGIGSGSAKSEVFSIYHALQLEREFVKQRIDDTVQDLLASCILRIQDCIRQRIPLFPVEIPFVKYKLNTAGERHQVFDKLVAELRGPRRKFTISDEDRSTGRFRLHCWSKDPEITLLDSETLSSSTTTTPQDVLPAASTPIPPESPKYYASSQSQPRSQQQQQPDGTSSAYSPPPSPVVAAAPSVGNSYYSTAPVSSNVSAPTSAFPPQPQQQQPMYLITTPQQMLSEYTQSVLHKPRLTYQISCLQQQQEQIQNSGKAVPTTIKHELQRLCWSLQHLEAHIGNLSHAMLRQMSLASLEQSYLPRPGMSMPQWMSASPQQQQQQQPSASVSPL